MVVRRSSERRASPRNQKLLRVYVSDPADALDEFCTGWITDRSKGGICLSFRRSPAELGNILKVQLASSSADMPWVEVCVKSRREKANRVELGCEFVQKQRWEQILLLD